MFQHHKLEFLFVYIIHGIIYEKCITGVYINLPV